LFYPASIVKLVYGLATFYWIKKGSLLLSDELIDAVRKMLSFSSNNATSFLIDLLTGTTSGPCIEGELWETTQHIAEINAVIIAPKNICKKLGLDENSCWQLCCAAVLDSSRPLKNGQNRVDDFKELINRYEISYI